MLASTALAVEPISILRPNYRNTMKTNAGMHTNNKTQINAGLHKMTSSIVHAVKCISRHMPNYRNTTKEYAGLILQTNIWPDYRTKIVICIGAEEI
jgi:hypothetical protein